MIRTIGDYHNAVIGRATQIKMSRVTVGKINDFEDLLAAGDHYPRTSETFADVRYASVAWIRAARQILGGRWITIEPPEPESELLRQAILTYCRDLMPPRGKAE